MSSFISETKEESVSNSVAPKPFPSLEKTTPSIEAQSTPAMAINNMAATVAEDTAITHTVVTEAATAEVHPLTEIAVAMVTMPAADTNRIRA